LQTCCCPLCSAICIKLDLSPMKTFCFALKNSHFALKKLALLVNHLLKIAGRQCFVYQKNPE
jgi:hypothetical protein